MDLNMQKDVNTSMDPTLYKAASNGQIEDLYFRDPLNLQLTLNRSTILHVHLTNKSVSADFVNTVLDKYPSLLSQPNINGETPLHIAARHGHTNVVDAFIEQTERLHADLESEATETKKMLRSTNEEGETALHEAARNNQLDVVKILTSRDVGYSYPANNSGETPLYIASLRGYSDVVDSILETRTSVPRGGCNGRTALHAAVMSRDAVTAEKVLAKTKAENLTKETDDNGWSPLHYAAYLGDRPILKLLLQSDCSAVYIADKNRKSTALHIAALQGHTFIVKDMILNCPDCCELVDNKGWNALHYATVGKNVEVFKLSLGSPSLGKLINQKDQEGNTPLHLLAASCPNLLSFVNQPKVNIHALNKQNVGVHDILSGSFPQAQKEILKSLEDVRNELAKQKAINQKSCWELVEKEVKEKEAKEDKEDAKEDIEEAKLKKSVVSFGRAKDAHLVVAALIATVTFTAAFTLPGGFKGEDGPHPGTAILSRNAAFITFVVADAMSMVLSLFAVFIHFLVAVFKYDEYLEYFLLSAAVFTILAMGAMMLAFISGTYAVLAPCLGLAIATIFIGLTFFIVTIYFFIRWFIPYLFAAICRAICWAICMGIRTTGGVEEKEEIKEEDLSMIY